MNEDIVKNIANELKVRISQVTSTLELLQDENTIPFIARYRKEATGGLDEEQIRSISEVYEYEKNLLERKEAVIRLIDEKGLMNEELRKEILKAKKLVEVEDLYRPFKEKKKTKATLAIDMGLKPLAQKMMTFPLDGTIETLCAEYINDKVVDTLSCITGAKYIIAEEISDNTRFRTWIRNYMYNEGIIRSKKKKNAKDDEHIYDMYYQYESPVKWYKPHRILAMNRGEKEGVLSIDIDVDKQYVLDYIAQVIIKNNKSYVCKYVLEAIEDAYTRLIQPSIEREIRADITEKSGDVAIDVFAKNLENLLLQPPMKDKVVLGLDPAYRTGCKLAVIDSTGKYLDISVIYPHEPKKEYEKSQKHVLDLIDKYNVDIIAIGNGTASRESESFVADTIKKASRDVKYIIVNEAGASVYSASKLAIKEFPDLHVEERSAISIARRLQDPLAELVKIDSKSIGVGQYQHDVSEKKLDQALGFVVVKTVNKVGVNLNTASQELLSFVSGMDKRNITKLLKFRDETGKIDSREKLRKLNIIDEKTYQQSIGFMRIEQGKNPLDRTSIHPESYTVAQKVLEYIEEDVSNVGKEQLINKVNKLDIPTCAKMFGTDEYTMQDIFEALKASVRDPREDIVAPVLKSDVLKFEDLKEGMKLQGTVRNVVDFGAFIDIGIKKDGLVHISKMSEKRIKHPSELVSVGDIVDCYVIEINQDKKKVSLSLVK